ncbi:DUF7344 domain-containing protein [Natrinema salifodinae]|uniref:DUF7344 domain-containing protein n=1 Tax=Natrinema salifodinae TaxID=1202768 RepID=A0A1I0QA88_9EURY|nr:hypothetical protein [Natrinema salifodinae]SEW23941.1 hypothetical protein SAMN05216285_3298 [Natrinema salifodinae]
MKSTQLSGGETEATAIDDDADVDPNADTATEDALPADEIFHLLQNERRRLVLRYLSGTEETVRMRDVAEQVAAWEHDTTVAELTSDQRQRVYIPLYQSHLPKLDKAGVIDYQQSRGLVERKPLADELDQYLEPAPTADADTDASAEQPSGSVTWDDYSIAVTGLGGLLLLGSVLELPGISVLSGLSLSAVILLLFTLLTAGRYID